MFKRVVLLIALVSIVVAFPNIDAEQLKNATFAQKLERINKAVATRSDDTFSDNYYLGSTKLDFFAARMFCLEMGWKLLSLETEATQTNFVNFVKYHQITTTGYWTSGNRLQGPWTWDLCGSSEFTYTNWAGGEPNNVDGNEQCMHTYGGTSQFWNDRACTFKAYFVCEKK